MALVVQKFGGTSVGSVERIQAVAQRVMQTVAAGNQVAVVVSAMGKTTDGLVKLANQISETPSRREMDMLLSTGEQVSIALLSMALQAAGQDALSLTGAQVGIVTEADHTRARILNIRTERIQRHLNDGKVVVVAGFQGISQRIDIDFEITTLGRGGSDTSAVALAAALGADKCEIYTDVPGILTTDPRLVPEAHLIKAITCDEMLELASLGAKVLHPRAVEIARNYGIPLVVRSSWVADPGTHVVAPSRQPKSLEGLELVHPVDAIEFDLDQAKVALLRIPDRPGIAARLFGELADQDLNVDLVIQSIHEGNTNDIAFTVLEANFAKAEAVAAAIAPVLRGDTADSSQAEVFVDRQVAKISIAGAGMIGRPGVAAQMFSTLAEAAVNIQMISTSEVKVSCTIDSSDCDRAISALCNAFQVTCSPLRDASQKSLSPVPEVRGAALDQKQAQIAIRHVPDRPGMAARIFALLAKAGISVDMIIQSQRCRMIGTVATRDIAFTVAQAEAAQAKATVAGIADEMGCGDIVVNDAIAKVSVVGIGMINTPGVAARMFEALAQQRINIQMIATSEIKISCLVAEDDGVRALKAVHDAFKLYGTEKVVVPA
ncbi:aspartate kinase [Oscillatoria sp. CS-180]|uniref:aspartate kinase n=1 Tax=Oscillatoria sp. CS-180 TaxID=3021720 RepID=UPI00232CD3A7|nr:aspartate kinase [Oscillatoria sp. CS-180]MDB9526826.1 aspartate kinase [Oscillatoria sp. CS-180]